MLGYLSRPNVILQCLKSKKETGERQRNRCDNRCEQIDGRGPQIRN
jgi:hypothetical protein